MADLGCAGKFGVAKTVIMIAVALCILPQPVAAGSDEFERPQPVEPAKIHGRKAFGANYQLQNPVRSDGFLRFYKISTFYGSFDVIGDELLKVRLRELAALQLMDELKLDAAFNEGFDKAVGTSFGFKRSIKKPPKIKSQGNISGIGILFQNIEEKTKKPGEGVVAGSGRLRDVGRAKRIIAENFGVDPYSDFPPLAKRLRELSRAGMDGARVVGLSLAALPGVSASLANDKANTRALDLLIRNKTPRELKAYNRRLLIDMDIDEATVEGFLANAFYTISDQTALSAALERLADVSSRRLFLARAATAAHREVAYFHRRRAELLADFHERKSALKNFVLAAGFPLVQTQEDKMLIVFAVDELAWTANLAEAVKSINRSVEKQKFKGGLDLYLTGTATKKARMNFKKLNWNVFTKVEFN